MFTFKNAKSFFYWKRSENKARNDLWDEGIFFDTKRHLNLAFEKIGVENPNASGDTEKGSGAEQLFLEMDQITS